MNGTVMTNAVIAAGCGTLAAVGTLFTRVGTHGGRGGNPALAGFLAFVVVFCGLMAWDVSR